MPTPSSRTRGERAAPRAGSWLRRSTATSWSFRRSPITMVAAVVTLLFFLLALFAPHRAAEPVRPGAAQSDEFADLAAWWTADGQSPSCSAPTTRAATCFPRSSTACALSLVVGCRRRCLRRLARHRARAGRGYVGGAVDALIMRIADVQLTFPAILIALLDRWRRRAARSGCAP